MEITIRELQDICENADAPRVVIALAEIGLFAQVTVGLNQLLSDAERQLLRTLAGDAFGGWNTARAIAALILLKHCS